jgi:hypothetical protein
MKYRTLGRTGIIQPVKVFRWVTTDALTYRDQPGHVVGVSYKCPPWPTHTLLKQAASSRTVASNWRLWAFKRDGDAGKIFAARTALCSNSNRDVKSKGTNK